MNHIQYIISQPSINLQQGQHVLCLHKFFVVLAFWLYFTLVFIHKVCLESNENLVFNVSLSIFLITFKAKGLVSIYYQFFLARIIGGLQKTINKVVMKNMKIIFSNYLNWGKRFLTQRFNGSVIYNQWFYFYHYCYYYFYYYYYYCSRLDTVKEVLRQVKAKAESLGFESTNLVFDHAIYAKAVEILTNPANKQVSLISEWVRFMLAVYTWQNLVEGLVLQDWEKSLLKPT